MPPLRGQYDSESSLPHSGCPGAAGQRPVYIIVHFGAPNPGAEQIALCAACSWEKSLQFQLCNCTVLLHRVFIIQFCFGARWASIGAGCITFGWLVHFGGKASPLSANWLNLVDNCLPEPPREALIPTVPFKPRRSIPQPPGAAAFTSASTRGFFKLSLAEPPVSLLIARCFPLLLKTA